MSDTPRTDEALQETNVALLVQRLARTCRELESELADAHKEVFRMNKLLTRND